MSTANLSARAVRAPFGSASWLTAAGQLPQPAVGPDTVALRLEIVDGTDIDVRVDLAGGRLAVHPAGGELPRLLLRMPRTAAADLLLGSATQRAGVTERGDVTIEGNFSLLFFIDAALQEDRAGHVAALRAVTTGTDMPADAPTVRPGSSPSGPDERATEQLARAREALPATLRELEREVGTSTPGAQLYVSLGGEPLADVGVGLARPGVAMTHRSWPLWYCCAKPLLSVSLGQLWEQGRFDPYLPVAHYLPDFAAHGKDRVTAAHLLTHTGPVATGHDPLHGVLTAPHEERRRRAFALAVPPQGDAQPMINYSQWWAWFVLAELLPAIDGRDYASYVADEVLRPCRMDATRIRLSHQEYEAARDVLPLIHVSNTGGPPIPTSWWSTRAATTRLVPGVNTRGPLRDQGRLLEMLLAGGAAPGGRVLSPSTVAALTARHRSGLRDRYGNADWGFGLRLECRHLDEGLTSFGTYTSPRSYGHDGLWTAVCFADPDAGLAVAVHLNGKVEHERHRERILRIADAIYSDVLL